MKVVTPKMRAKVRREIIPFLDWISVLIIFCFVRALDVPDFKRQSCDLLAIFGLFRQKKTHLWAQAGPSVTFCHYGLLGGGHCGWSAKHFIANNQLRALELVGDHIYDHLGFIGRSNIY